MEKTKKNDFVEIEFIGKVKDGEMFDTNIPSEAVKLGVQGPVKKLIVCIGQEMVIAGFDKDLEGKEIGKKYSIELNPKDGFGERKGGLVKLIPLSSFRRQNIDPRPGMTLNMDNMLVRIISVSGGRVLADFNNPLAGKDIVYEYTIKSKIDDDKEKIEAIISYFLKREVKFIIEGKKAILDLEEMYDPMLEFLNKRFKDIIGIELSVKKAKKTEKVEAKK